MKRIYRAAIYDRSLGTLLFRIIRSNSDDFVRSNVQRYLSRHSALPWREVFSYAFRCFLPLFIENRAFSEAVQAPPEIREEIKMRYLYNVSKNQKKIAAIKDLAQAFDAAGITFVLLKGAAYFGTIYAHDPGLRFMADIDFLVKKDQFDEAVKILEIQGFAEDYERLSIAWGGVVTKEFFFREHFHYVFYKGEIKIEPHWDLTHESPAVFLQNIFETLDLVTVQGVSVPTVSPAMSFYLTCLNMVRDVHFPSVTTENAQESVEQYLYSCLFFIYEFKRLWGYYHKTVSWDRFFLFCDSNDYRQAIVTLLFCTFKLLELPVPEAVSKRFQKSKEVRVIQFMLRGVDTDDFCKVFILRGMVVDLWDGKCFRENRAMFFFRLKNCMINVIYFYSPPFFNLLMPVLKLKRYLRALFKSPAWAKGEKQP